MNGANPTETAAGRVGVEAEGTRRLEQTQHREDSEAGRKPPPPLVEAPRQCDTPARWHGG